MYVSEPLPGSIHDKTAFDLTPVAEIVAASGGGIGDKGYQGTNLATPRKKPKNGSLSIRDLQCNAEISVLRAPIERVVGHFKSWRILHTDYRRPEGLNRSSQHRGWEVWDGKEVWSAARGDGWPVCDGVAGAAAGGAW